MKKGKGNRAQIMQPDVWTMSIGVIMPGLSDYADCRCMSELPPAPPATMGQLRETTRSKAIAHVIYTCRTNRFPVNCPARRTHRHVLSNTPHRQLRVRRLAGRARIFLTFAARSSQRAIICFDARNVSAMWAAGERPFDELVSSYGRKSVTVKLPLRTKFLSDAKNDHNL